MATGHTSRFADAGDVSFDQSFSQVNRPGGQAGVPASNRPSAGPSTEDVWTQILLSVRTARSTPVFPVIILGEPQSGKSTLIRGLAEGCPRGYIEVNDDGDGDEEGEGAVAEAKGHTVTQPVNGDADGVKDATTTTGNNQPQYAQKGRRDMGLAYGYCDVLDDEGEDILARLSLYTLSSSSDALLPLLSIALGNHEAHSATTSAKAAKKEPIPKPEMSLAAVRDSLVLIVLDWRRPQAFLEELRTWISIIKETVAAAVRTGNDDRERREQEVMLEEMKDAIETYLRTYTPPGTTGQPPVGIPAETESRLSGSQDSPNGLERGGAGGDDPSAGGNASVPTIVPVSAPLALSQGKQDFMPLDEGTLNDNLGVNVVVVLTKSDTVVGLERDRGFKEEQFDYIQQVLRTICLKYGAALFSTAHNRQGSYDVLRQYLLHRLFSSMAASDSLTGTRVPFNYAPATIERDVLLVPTGWDSWGKIVALRDGFSPQATAQGWEWDCEVETSRRSRQIPKDRIDEVERELQQQQMDGGGGGSACRLWEDVVGDWKASATTNLSTGKVAPPDSQAFLAQHYAALQKEGALGGASSTNGSSDPRAKFAPKAGGSGGPGTPARDTASSSRGDARGVVGPLQSSSLLGPAVERAIGLAQRDEHSANGAVADSSAGVGLSSPTPEGREGRATRRRDSKEHTSGSTSAQRRTSTGVSRPQSPFVPPGATGAGNASRDGALASPTSPGISSPSATTKQSEVLQSFFQDLLRGKSSSGPSGMGGGGSAGGGGGLGSSATSRGSQGPRPT